MARSLSRSQLRRYCTEEQYWYRLGSLSWNGRVNVVNNLRPWEVQCHVGHGVRFSEIRDLIFGLRGDFLSTGLAEQWTGEEGFLGLAAYIFFHSPFLQIESITPGLLIPN